MKYRNFFEIAIIITRECSQIINKNMPPKFHMTMESFPIHLDFVSENSKCILKSSGQIYNMKQSNYLTG